MVNTKMLSQHVSDASISNNIIGPQALTLENKFSYNVMFANDGKHAKAVIGITVTDKTKEMLKIHALTEGVFEISGVDSDTDRKVAHTKCFDELFEHAANNVKALSKMAGVNFPVMKPKFGFDDIQVGQMPAGLNGKLPS